MEDNREYSIPDIETGYRVRVSKKAYEAYLEAVESLRPKLSKTSRQVILYGTAGDIEGSEDLSKIFYSKDDI